MKIILDTMEVVWLQNIKREPGKYALGSTRKQREDNKWFKVQNTLLQYGLIRFKWESVLFHDRLFITALGEAALKANTPFIDRTINFPYELDPLDTPLGLTVYPMMAD
jgi:hypothetical protein